MGLIPLVYDFTTIWGGDRRTKWDKTNSGNVRETKEYVKILR